MNDIRACHRRHFYDILDKGHTIAAEKLRVLELGAAEVKLAGCG